MLISIAHAQAADGAGGAAAMVTQLAPLLLIFAVFYFLLIRPQQRKQREQREMLKQLKRGDRVLTAGGIIGQVTRVKEGADEVEVEIAPNVRVNVLRTTITDVFKPVPAGEKAEAAKS
ncbi:MAG TPA: preprotein translocase subunit YajC [Crenalkalicoccus sp.]|jgi:preprotein translocase subunit YajC|nr:preprotein translocase subunit YajC [Crenalkalicoccus sp.]